VLQVHTRRWRFSRVVKKMAKRYIPAGTRRKLRQLGTREGRATSSTRRRLARSYLRGEGLEIGALHMPLKLPPQAKVRYVDRLSVAGLREHYPELKELELVEVDVIDDGERLTTIADSSVDFLVANHFLEHCQDPIGTLANHFRVLRPGGTLYLAVPDKRYTFDRERPVTPLGHVIRDHTEGPAWSRSEHYLEWAEKVDRVLNDVPEEEATERAHVFEKNQYSIHFHVWTPTDFLEMLIHCRTTLLPELNVLTLQQNSGEFIAVISKDGNGAAANL
jgi:SAM-dependent methyltransferase